MLHLGMTIYIYVHIVIPRSSKARITAASMKKSPFWRIFTVFKISKNMTIGQDQYLPHSNRCLLKLGNGNLLIAELPNSIHISPVYLHKIQDESGIAISESIRHIVKKIFSDINGNFNAPEHQWIFRSQREQHRHQRTAQLI